MICLFYCVEIYTSDSKAVVDKFTVTFASACQIVLMIILLFPRWAEKKKSKVSYHKSVSVVYLMRWCLEGHHHWD